MYKYCPQCKTELILGKEKKHEPYRLLCPKCRFIFYNNPRPGAGALICKDGKIMLLKRAEKPQKGFWDFPGGYIETYESPEECAIREIKEETGYTIKLDKLFGIYLEKESGELWTVLCIYYLAEITKGQLHLAPEIAELKWFSPDKLPHNLAFPHTKKCLEDWKRKLEINSMNRKV
jgi:ADP-ribose pyrophosphatase YjhB (NUDIX family)